MNIIIDGKVCEAERGEFILDIAKRNGIYIPTLCHSDALPGQGNCRLCIVEVVENKRSRVVTSCIFPVNREAEVLTNSKKIRDMRKTIIMLLLSRVPHDKNLQSLAKEYDVPEVNRFHVDEKEGCILCGLCVRACEEMGQSAISTVNRGVFKKVSTPYDEPPSVCIGCGACAHVCPTGEIKMCDRDGVRTIWNKEFKLIKCPKCGKYYATYEQVEYLKGKLQGAPGEILCSNCKMKAAAEKLRDIYEGVKVE